MDPATPTAFGRWAPFDACISLLLLLLMVLSLFCCIVAFMLRQLIARLQLMDLAIHENNENTFYVGRDMKTSVGVVVTLM